MARRYVLAATVLIGLAPIACSSDAERSTAAEDSAPRLDDATAADSPDASDATCVDPGDDAQPWERGPSAELVTLADGDDGPRVRAAVYPHPNYEGNPWSQWGQGVVLLDGRFLSAIGDHLGRDGNSYLYEFDPVHDRLIQIGDVASFARHEEGDWGYGKVHAQMVAGPCGEVYVASYWGTRDGLVYGGSYSGDILLRLDPTTRTSENLGPILEEHGVPSMAGWADGGLIYAEAADPDLIESQRGAFVVVDMATGDQLYATDDEDHRGFRAMAVDGKGRVLYSRAQGRLARWDPVSGEVGELDSVLRGEFLRAATQPAPDGTVYLVTQAPDVLYALHPDGSLRELGELEGYTASLAMSPDGERLWYVPDAHGGAAARGTPVIEVDTTTGEQRVVVELDPLARETLGLSLGGSYNVAVDSSGSVLYLGMNAAEPGADDPFGEVVLIVVDLP